MAMRQVCDQLGLHIGKLQQGAQAIIKKESVTNPSDKQLKEAKMKAAEECYALLFLYFSITESY